LDKGKAGLTVTAKKELIHRSIDLIIDIGFKNQALKNN